MGRVQGKTAIVTGGSKGIGEACAVRLAEEGARVTVTDIDEENGAIVADKIKDSGHAAEYVNLDVASEEDWKRVIATVADNFGGLHVLVNNAGVGVTGNVETISKKDWDFLTSINLDGVFLGTKYAIPVMKESGGGSIINMSSILGLVGDPGLAAYVTSKGGVRLLTKSAALYCARSGYNIRVNSVHPGYIKTPMVMDFSESTGDADGTLKALEALHPVGHLGEPDDVAWGVVYLASDESKFVTGAELVIDGGYTAQ